MKQPAARANRLDRVLLGASLVAAVSFVAWRTGRGYGLDNDTYAMLATWQEMVHHGRYVASRYTGYIVAEFAIGAAAAWGGAVAANLAMALCAAVGLAASWSMARSLGASRPALVLAL